MAADDTTTAGEEPDVQPEETPLSEPEAPTGEPLSGDAPSAAEVPAADAAPAPEESPASEAPASGEPEAETVAALAAVDSPAAAAEELEPPAEEAPEPPDEEAPAAEAVAAPVEVTAPERRTKKRLPRALRRKRPRPVRDQSAPRKPIVRLPKPEGERGARQERRGVVVSAAMDKTIVVKVDTIKAHRRYKKVVRRSRKFHAHDEANRAKAGDIVRIVETRPISKTKTWRLAEVLQEAQ